MLARNYYPFALVVGVSLLVVPLKTGAQNIDASINHVRLGLQASGFADLYEETGQLSDQTILPRQSSLTSGIFGGEDIDLSLFGNFGNNIVNSFTGGNLYLQLAAVAATPILVNNNVDYHIERYFNQHPLYGKLARPVPFTGNFLPIIVGGSLLAYAEVKNDDEVLGASFAVIQASLIELMDNTLLKAVTGRPGPSWRHNSNMEDLSETFRFGFLRGGVVNGWPSGHTGATMAVVSALTSYYPDKTWLKIAGYGFVAYTMFGVSSVNRGGMHWFSDAVAGALMSYTIGSTVGKYYRNVYSSLTGEQIEPSSNRLSFGITPAGIGISFHF